MKRSILQAFKLIGAVAIAHVSCFSLTAPKQRYQPKQKEHQRYDKQRQEQRQQQKTARSKLLIRQIKSQPSNVTNVIRLLSPFYPSMLSSSTQQEQQQIDDDRREILNVQSSKNVDDLLLLDDAPIVEALRVCGKVQRPDVALKIFQCHPTETSRTMTISVLGTCQEHETAISLLDYHTNDDGDENDKRRFIPNTSISINNHNSNLVTATAASFNAAIAACGKAKDWKLAMHVYENLIPRSMISTVTVKALLSILTQCRRGNEALKVIQSMPCQPDQRCYQYVIQALTRCNLVNLAYEQLQYLHNNQQSIGIAPSDAMFDIVLAACSKQSNNDNGNDNSMNNCSHIENIEAMRYGHRKKVCNNNNDHEIRHHIFHQWEGLTKVGQGKSSYWEIATYLPLNITIGACPNRNPAKNGIQLVFYENYYSSSSMTGNDDDDDDNDDYDGSRHDIDPVRDNVDENDARDEDQDKGEKSTSKNKNKKQKYGHGTFNSGRWKRRKLGYLLMQNNINTNESCLLGMFLNNQCRRNGISKVALATWLWFCQRGEILPTTGIINKPLLALQLQHRFGFTASSSDGNSVSNSNRRGGNGDGIKVEVAPDPTNPERVLICSKRKKSLEGAFSPWDLQHQNLRIVHALPEPEKGRLVHVRTTLHAPTNSTLLRQLIHDVVPDNSLQCVWNPVTKRDIRLIYMGQPDYE